MSGSEARTEEGLVAALEAAISAHQAGHLDDAEIVLVDAPLGHDRAGARGRSRGVRADVAGAPVRRVLMGVLRLRHVHLLHLVLQRRRNLRGLLTLPERTRGLVGRRGGHAHGRLGRRVRHHGRRGHDGGRWLLRQIGRAHV